MGLYDYTTTYENNTLQHHGILGQKWGVRRFQNEDGSLTSAGRKRYDVGEKMNGIINKNKEKKIKSVSESIENKNKLTEKYISENGELTEKGLKKYGYVSSIIKDKKKLAKYIEADQIKKKEDVKTALRTVGAVAGTVTVTIGAAYITKKFDEHEKNKLLDEIEFKANSFKRYAQIMEDNGLSPEVKKKWKDEIAGNYAVYNRNYDSPTAIKEINFKNRIKNLVRK